MYKNLGGLYNFVVSEILMFTGIVIGFELWFTVC